MHHRVDQGVPQPTLVQVADVELQVRALDPDERVEVVGLAPAPTHGSLVPQDRQGRIEEHTRTAWTSTMAVAPGGSGNGVNGWRDATAAHLREPPSRPGSCERSSRGSPPARRPR